MLSSSSALTHLTSIPLLTPSPLWPILTASLTFTLLRLLSQKAFPDLQDWVTKYPVVIANSFKCLPLPRITRYWDYNGEQVRFLTK